MKEAVDRSRNTSISLTARDRGAKTHTVSYNGVRARFFACAAVETTDPHLTSAEVMKCGWRLQWSLMERRVREEKKKKKNAAV